MWLVIILMAASLCFAQSGSTGNSADAANFANAADTSSANQAIFADIDIFAKMPLGSVLILWSNFELVADIKRQIMSRSFVAEPYFMQNIDREQFEQNQILHLFEEQKSVFFKLFPDEEED